MSAPEFDPTDAKNALRAEKLLLDLLKVMRRVNLPEQYAAHVDAWLASNQKDDNEVRWGEFPLGMVGRWIERAEQAEAALQAARAERDLARDEARTYMGEQGPYLKNQIDVSDAALQAAQEALRDLDAACEGVTAWKNHAALRAFEESWERARAVLDEGADGLADSNWCNRP